MKSAIAKLYRSSLDLIQSQGSVALFVILLSLAVLFYTYIPEAGALIAVLGTISFQLYNCRAYSRCRLICGASILLGCMLYGIILLTLSEAQEAMAFSAMFLWMNLVLLHYYSAKKDFVSELINRLAQTLIAFAYLITIYVIIYLVSYFINNIFGLNFLHSDLLFRSASALSAFVWFMVMFSYKSNPRWQPGRFFNMLFGIMIPRLSIVAGFLALIYLLQVSLGYREDMAFRYIYYPFIILFYMVFIFSWVCSTSHRERKIIIFLFMALTLVSSFFILKRQLTIPSQQYSSIYSLLLNLLFFLYNLALLRRWTTIDIRFSQAAALMALIVFMPLIGYVNYTNFVTYTGKFPNLVPHYSLGEIFSRQKEESNLAYFQAIRQLQNNADQSKENPAVTKDNVHFTTSTSYVNISPGGFSYMAVGVTTNMHAPYSYQGVTLTLSEDRKILQISEAGKPPRLVPIYDLARQAAEHFRQESEPAAGKPDPIDMEPLIIRDENYLLIIQAYNYINFSSPPRPGKKPEIETNIRFTLLVK